MRIGFYAPLKAPDHPVPSGDRQMARAFLAALSAGGHKVDLYSTLRSFCARPDEADWADLRATADAEFDRLCTLWTEPARRPDLLFTYHLYYKAPDLLGAGLAKHFALPYVTAEATLSSRRVEGPWAARQALVAEAVRDADLNICFTDRDRAGLDGIAAPASLLVLPPFIDAAGFHPKPTPSQASPVRLVVVAMMRPGDKLKSYEFLAEALSRLPPQPWHLTVIGGGAARADVEQALAVLPAERVRYCGEIASDAVPGQLRDADVLVWPGFAEAFGLCYLEAQACGLPVVAVRNAGTPSVIRDGETGLLTDADPEAYARAIARLISDAPFRMQLGVAASTFVRRERTIERAGARLGPALEACRRRWAA